MFAIHSQCSEERLTLKLSAQERQHQRSIRSGVYREQRAWWGENGCRKLTAGIQEEPKWWDPPPGPGGSPRERLGDAPEVPCSQCREEVLRLILLPDSLGRKATGLPTPEGSPTGSAQSSSMKDAGMEGWLP